MIGDFSAVANHLWQSTAVAGIAGGLALCLRQNQARIRFGLWLAASFKFLVPFSLLMRLGGLVEWKAVQAAAAPLSLAMEPVAGQISASGATVRVVEAQSLVAPALIAIWICGSAAILCAWWFRWRRIHSVLRTATPASIPAPLRVMSAPSRLEPGVFGVFRPVLLLPEGLVERLPDAQLQAILAHEFCHFRRRDNLASAFHMIVEALFWFHPLVWWIGARLVEERERACDEEVIRLGSSPNAYVSGIVTVCRLYLETPLACASGVTGADLKKRAQAILSGGSLRRLSLARKLLLSSAALGAIAVPIVVGIAGPSAGRAQSADRKPLRFEVASIKPVHGNMGRGSMEVLPGGGLRMGGVTIKELVQLAYDARPEQVTGGPRWADSESYSLLAKPESAAAADNPSTVVAPGTTAWDRLRERLRTLLAERCQLTVHVDEKQGSGYELVVAKGGPKMHTAAASGPPRTNRSFGAIEAHSGTTQMLATVLSGMLGRPVVNRTGLDGAYDYKLEYSQPRPAGQASSDAPAPPLPDDAGPSVFTALQEQLGLKLDKARVAVKTIVIDRLEKPSEN